MGDQVLSVLIDRGGAPGSPGAPGILIYFINLSHIRIQLNYIPEPKTYKLNLYCYNRERVCSKKYKSYMLN